ncbi:MAG: hypothetical protein DME26_09850, partial [Verrucomicrobia bacterium]
VELWFSDETGVEGDPRPRRRWVQPGRPRTLAYLGDHIRQNLIGAVCPHKRATVQFGGRWRRHDVFQLFLDEMAKTIPKAQGKRQLLMVDNAS